MGIESFWMDIYIAPNCADEVLSLAKSKSIYTETLQCYFMNDDKHILGVAASVCSFFPMCEVMYKLCKDVSKICTVEKVGTIKNATHAFDFENWFDFMKWMYENWSWKVDGFNKDWGILTMKPSDFYTARRKLRKKYFHNFNKDD